MTGGRRVKGSDLKLVLVGDFICYWDSGEPVSDLGPLAFRVSGFRSPTGTASRARPSVQMDSQLGPGAVRLFEAWGVIRTSITWPPGQVHSWLLGVLTPTLLCPHRVGSCPLSHHPGTPSETLRRSETGLPSSLGWSSSRMRLALGDPSLDSFSAAVEQNTTH